MVVRGRAKSSSISATIIRADGRTEQLGIIAYWHRNPIMRLLGNAFISLKEKFRW